MANRSVEIALESSSGCEKSNDKICPDSLTTNSYMEEYKSGDIWNKDEETIYLGSNRRHEKKSSCFEPDEEIVNERKENSSSPPLYSEKGNSEKSSTNFQEMMRTSESNCQDSDMKPTHSYIALIAMAILSSSGKKMILGDIYEYISDNFPYYRNKDKSWRNSIRHNLSLNECFIKAGRSENGKGNYWAIHPANLEDFANGDFRRRRARRRVRKSSALKFANGTAAYLRSLSMFSPVHHNSMFSYRTSDYRMFSHPYLPGQDRKNLSVLSSYGIPSTSLCLSDSTQTSCQPFTSGGSLQPCTNPNFLTAYTPYHEHDTQSTHKPVNSELKRLQDGILSSAFMPYSNTTSQLFNSESESWQETLSKLQDQLRKAP